MIDWLTIRPGSGLLTSCCWTTPCQTWKRTGIILRGWGTYEHKTYPLVICYITIENGHRNSGFTHQKWRFSIAMLKYQRVFGCVSGETISERGHVYTINYPLTLFFMADEVSTHHHFRALGTWCTVDSQVESWSWHRQLKAGARLLAWPRWPEVRRSMSSTSSDSASCAAPDVYGILQEACDSDRVHLLPWWPPSMQPTQQ